MAKSKKRIQNYVIDQDKILGKGSFGDVYLCQHETSKLTYVAKIMSKSKLQSDPYMKHAFQQQIQIQSSLKHKNIVEFIDVLETSNNFYIIQEYCQNGTLRNNNQVLNKHGQLSQADALHCLKCLCLGFTEIAKKGVIHSQRPQTIKHSHQIKLNQNR